MGIIVLLLLVLAFFSFVLAAFGVGLGRVNLLALGLAFWVLAVQVPHLVAL